MQDNTIFIPFIAILAAALIAAICGQPNWLQRRNGRIYLTTLAWLLTSAPLILSLLFALPITGIGTLIIIYTGYYFQKEPSAWRFLSFLWRSSSETIWLTKHHNLYDF